MRHRIWLLALPALTLAYWALLSVGGLMNLTPWLVMGGGRTDMVLFLGLGGLASWTVLESVVYAVTHRPKMCVCGYHLAGLKCPECGRDLGGTGK